MRVPAVLAAVPLLSGAAAGVLLVDSTPFHHALAASAASLLALIAGCGFFAERWAPAVSFAATIGFASAGFALGAASASVLHAPPLLAWFKAHAREDSEPVELIGVLRDDAAAGENGVLLTLDTAGGGVRLSVAGAAAFDAVEEWRAGRAVRLPALLREPTTFRNPGVMDDRPALARRGVSLVGTVKSAALVEVIEQGSGIEEMSAAGRAYVRAAVRRHVGRFDRRSAAVASAILIGDRSGLSDDDERRMQDAGTYHVIAISGGNIAILTAALLFAARLARVPRRAAALATIGVLLLYGEVAGGAASVSRAISAAVIFLFALVLDHRGRPLNTLGVAAILAVAVSPVAVLDAGFQLSFGATAGIVLGVPGLLRAVPRWRLLAGLTAATACAELALAPIAAGLFSRVTIAGLVLNVAAIPLMTVVQLGALAILVLAPLAAQGADATGFVVHHAAQLLVDSSRLLDHAPWLAQDVAPPAWWVTALYYAGCAALFHARTRRGGIAAMAGAILLVAAVPNLAARGRLVPPASDVLRVVVLDVGQGDATLVQFPGGRALLVDAGGLAGTAFDIGGRVVIPALRALGARSLDALILTHGDPDHVGGADAIVRHFRPSEIWEGVPVPPHAVLRGLAQRAAAQQAAWRIVRPNTIDRTGEVVVRVLHPPEPDWERQRVRNDDSIVLEVRYRDVSILLPGDIGRETERALVPSLGALGRTVILKAAHHGSATSSSEELIDAIKPKSVIFSAGNRNRFGHPAPAVVERFARRGIPTFNTAVDGAVIVETNGVSARVWGWESRSIRDIQ